MSAQYPNVVHAFGAVNANGSSACAVECSSAKTGTGEYGITLDQPVDATQCAILVTLRGAASGVARVVHTSDTVKQVLTFNVDGTTAADKAFDILVMRAPY